MTVKSFEKLNKHLVSTKRGGHKRAVQMKSMNQYCNRKLHNNKN